MSLEDRGKRRFGRAIRHRSKKGSESATRTLGGEIRDSPRRREGESVRASSGDSFRGVVGGEGGCIQREGACICGQRGRVEVTRGHIDFSWILS